MPYLYVSVNYRRILFLLCCLSVGLPAWAQAPLNRQWDWALGAGAPGVVVGEVACESASGTLYAVGQADASGNFRFGSTVQNSISTRGKSVGLIASYTSSGTPLQLWQLGQGGTCLIGQIQVDSQGYLYIAGTFTGTCSFGSTVLTTPLADTPEPFVAKVAPWGAVQWAVASGSKVYGAQKLVLTPAGKLLLSYTVGYGPGTVGTVAYTAPGTANTAAGIATATIFAQLSTAGTIEWAMKVDDSAALIVATQQGGYYACGLVTTGTPTDPELLKLASNGQVVRRISLSGVTPYGTRQYSLATDALDNVYLSSNFVGSLRLDNRTLNSTPAYTDNGFIAKFNSSLTPQWITSTLQTQQRCLLIGANGAIYQVGEHQQTLTYGAYSIPYLATDQYDRNLYALRLTTSGAIDAVSKIGAPMLYTSYDNAVLDRAGSLVVSWREISHPSYTQLPRVSSLTPALGLSWQQNTTATGQLLAAAGGGIYQCGQLVPGYDANGWGYPGFQLYLRQFTTSGIKAWEQRISSGHSSTGWATAVYSASKVFTASSARGIDYAIGRGTFGTDPYRSDITRLSTLPGTTTFQLAYLSSEYQDAQTSAVALGGPNLVVATGYFTGTGRTWSNVPPYSATMLTSTASGTALAAPDAFVALYDTALSLRWIRQLGGSAVDKGTGVALDAMGCTYAVGTFTSTGVFLGTTLASAGGTDGYLVKLDPAGALLWAVRYGGTGNDEPAGVTLGKNGEVYVSGGFTGTARFGALTLTSSGGQDAFLARFDPTSGTTIWAQAAGGPGDDVATTVAVTSSGRVVVAGSFSGTATFGSVPLAATSGTDAFLAAYQPSGASSWAQRYGGTGNDVIRAVTALTNSKLALAGAFQGTLPLPRTTLRSQGGSDGFVATLDSTGAVEQAWGLGGPREDAANGLSADAFDNLYVAGAFSDSLQVGDQQVRSRSFEQNAFYARLSVAHTWTGSVSQSWLDSRNWSDGVVPTTADDVLLPTGAVRYPLLTAGNVQTGSLTLASGAYLSLSGGTLELTGNLTNLGGSIQQTGGIVRLTGATKQVLTSTSGPLLLSSLEVGAAGASLVGPLHIQQTLTLQGDLVSNGQLTLLSTAQGTALVVNRGAAVVTGNATVQRYLDPSKNPGPGYRHLAAPVSSAVVGDLATAGFAPEISAASSYNTSPTPGATRPFPTVFAYDQGRVASVTSTYTPFDKGFVVPLSLTTPLAVGQGYAVQVGPVQGMRFTGPLNNGDVSLALARNAATSRDAAEAGWHLVGNPYPSPLDFSLIAVADRLNLDASCYVNESSGPYAGTYRAYVNGVPAEGGLIGTAQGFFVRVSSDQLDGTLTFRNSQRVTSYATQVPVYRTTADERPLVQLALRASTGQADAFYAYAEAAATPAFDAHYDALKLPNATGLNVASMASSGQTLAIDGRAAFTTSTRIPLAIGVPAAGSYTLAGAQIANLPAGLLLYLHDKQTGQTLPLPVGATYSFSVSSTQATTLLLDRFTLQFSPQTALATTSSLPAAEVSVYPNPAHESFTVQLPALGTATQVQVELVNGLGQVVHRQAKALTATGAQFNVPTVGLATGIYSLRLHTGATTLVKRVVVE